MGSHLLVSTPDDLLFMREIVRLVRCLSPHSQGSEWTIWKVLSN